MDTREEHGVADSLQLHSSSSHGTARWAVLEITRPWMSLLGHTGPESQGWELSYRLRSQPTVWPAVVLCSAWPMLSSSNWHLLAASE